MSAKTIAELDEAVMSDLRPTCSAGRTPCYCDQCGGVGTHVTPCSAEATHAAVARCLGGCGWSDEFLCCAAHATVFDDFRDEGWYCNRCSQPASVRVVAL